MARSATARIMIIIVAVMALIIAMAGQIGRSALPPRLQGRRYRQRPALLRAVAELGQQSADDARRCCGDHRRRWYGCGGHGDGRSQRGGHRPDPDQPRQGVHHCPHDRLHRRGLGAAATATVATSGAVTGVTIDTPGDRLQHPRSPSRVEGLPPAQVGNPLVKRAEATDSPNAGIPRASVRRVPTPLPVGPSRSSSAGTRRKRLDPMSAGKIHRLRVAPHWHNGRVHGRPRHRTPQCPP